MIDALEAARVAGLLDELGGAPVRYRFSHALVQQTLLDEIPTARRLRFHRALAEAIERLRADRLDRYRAALARHWYEAGTEPARALDRERRRRRARACRSSPTARRCNGSRRRPTSSTTPPRPTRRASTS